MKHFWKKEDKKEDKKPHRLNRILFSFFVVVVVLFFLLKFSEIQKVFEILKKAVWWWLILAFFLQLFTYVFQAMVFKNILEILKRRTRLNYLYKCSVTITFLNITIPSGGMGGYIFFLHNLYKKGLKAGKAFMAIAFSIFIYYVTFLFLLLIGVIYLYINKALNVPELIGVSVLVAMVVCGFGYLYWLLKRRKRFYKTARWLGKRIKNADLDALDEFVDDIMSSKKIIKKNKLAFFRLFLWQLCFFICEIVLAYTVFLALRFYPNISVVVIGYAIARLFGLVSFLPGGIGAFEASMTLVFTGLGVPFEIGLMVTIIYRLFNYWLPLPLGLYFYRHLTHRKRITT